MLVCYLVDGVRQMIETGVERTGEEGPVRLRAAVCGTQIDTGLTGCMESAVRAIRRAFSPGAQVLCCQSCAHGNFYPVGDREDEIFCMADIAPRTVRDVSRVTEDDAERERRARRLLFFCDRYREINGTLYAYNDWDFRVRREQL